MGEPAIESMAETQDMSNLFGMTAVGGSGQTVRAVDGTPETGLAGDEEVEEEAGVVAAEAYGTFKA